MSASSGYTPLSQASPQQLADAFGVCDYFVYELDFPTIDSGASATNNFTVQADSNFLWQYGAFYASVAGAAFTDDTRPIPNCNLIITDSSSGRQLMSNAVPIASMFGTGQLPFQLPSPRFFRSNTIVSVFITNFDAAVDYDLKLSFIGTKFFQYD
jgi:hypothetical protein